MPDVFTCPECGLTWKDGRTECQHAIDYMMVERGIVEEPFYGGIPQGDGDGGSGDSAASGSGGVDASTGVEGQSVGESIPGSPRADRAGEGREAAAGGAPNVNPASDRAADSAYQINQGRYASLVDAAGQDRQIRASLVGPGGSDSGTVGSGPERNPAQGLPEGDATDARRRERFLANAKRWLTGGVEGQQELFEYMKLNLVVNMQYDQEEGQDVRNPESKSAATQARANRKQFKETSELVMAIVAAQNEEAKKVEKK